MSDYVVEAHDSVTVAEQAAIVYYLVCRCNFSAPGFALVRHASINTSIQQRRAMVALKEQLSVINAKNTGSSLEWFTINRFDQKNTTKLHRDGGPPESLLILGYEPTEIVSQLSIADYSRCAHAMNMTPDTFLEEFNPMYEKGLEKLASYTTNLDEFDHRSYQILVVNNSSTPFSLGEETWQGVLHGAMVLVPAGDEGVPRMINSTSIAPLNSSESLAGAQQLRQFIQEETISVSNYG